MVVGRLVDGETERVLSGYNSSAATRHHVGTPLDTPPMPSACPEIDAPQRDVSKPPPDLCHQRSYTLPPLLYSFLPVSSLLFFLLLVLLATCVPVKPLSLFGRCCRSLNRCILSFLLRILSSFISLYFSRCIFSFCLLFFLLRILLNFHLLGVIFFRTLALKCNERGNCRNNEFLIFELK